MKEDKILEEMKRGSKVVVRLVQHTYGDKIGYSVEYADTYKEFINARDAARFYQTQLMHENCKGVVNHG